ncbi:MAG: Minf_1886 family protein, partial [Planctomycetota bacterium]
MNGEIALIWERIHALDRPYPPAAYAFVQAGLRHTAERLDREHDDDESRHVSGQELCLGLREYAIKEYGQLTRTVLQTWRIWRTEDFGRIVFDLVQVGLLRKTDEDSLSDFQGVFDFDEAFGSDLDGQNARQA